MLDKKSLKSLVSNCYCAECSCSGEISFINLESDVAISVKCKICARELISNVPADNWCL